MMGFLTEIYGKQFHIDLKTELNATTKEHEL